MSLMKKPMNPSIVSRDLDDFSKDIENIYASIAVIAKRSRQINTKIKEELNEKLAEFASTSDNLDEVFENREQIEISKYYEQLPKPTIFATYEFLDDELDYRRVEESGESEFTNINL